MKASKDAPGLHSPSGSDGVLCIASTVRQKLHECNHVCCCHPGSLIRLKLRECTQTCGCCCPGDAGEHATEAMHAIADAVTQCKFEATDPAADEVVLYKILQVGR